MKEANETFNEAELWKKFIEKHGYTKGYVHFDKRTSLKEKYMQNYVMSPNKVAKHSFYPFIHFEAIAKRYKRVPEGVISPDGKRKNYEIKIKTRQLYYCSHKDRCVYQRYSFLINQKYNIWAKQHGLHDVAIAYRDNVYKNNIDFAKRAFDYIRKMEKCFIFIGDFTDFFDNINHKYLKKMLCKMMDVKCLPDDYYAVFKNITNFSSFELQDVYKAAGLDTKGEKTRIKFNEREVALTKKQFEDNKELIVKNNTGVKVPQGSPISAVLSNVYMIEIDEKIKDYVESKNGLYMRYSDDFIVILPYKKIEKVEAYKRFVMTTINSGENLVHLKEEKTDCYIYKDNKVTKYDSSNPNVNGQDNAIDLKYLGFMFNGLRIKMRPKAITKYHYRMRRKAYNIGRLNTNPDRTSQYASKNLYKIYSKNTKIENNPSQTFVDYAIKAKAIMQLDDPETEAVIKRHKQKIRKAIKEGYNKAIIERSREVY